MDIENVSEQELVEDIEAARLLADLEPYFGLDKRKPGDLDLGQIARHFGLGEEHARKRVYKLVADGVLVGVKVLGSNNRITKVYRRPG